MYRVIISDKARRDLDEIFSYIAENFNAGHSARKIVQKIEKRILTLDYMPRYKIFEPKPVYRQIHVGKYNIIFRINEQKKIVTVVRIVYSRKSRNHI